MIGSLLGALIGGFVASLMSSSLDSPIIFFIGVIISGVLSGMDDKIVWRVIGLCSFYIVSGIGFFMHSVFFNSLAFLGGILALLFYSPIIIILYFGSGWIVNKALAYI